MKPGIPWSIKGVEPELREIAKTAARRSGMTLGEWLNSAINEQADPVATSGDAPALETRSPRSSLISTHPMERAATKLEDIAAQLARLAARESEGSYRHPAPTVDEQVAMAKVLARVESNEKQTVEAFSAVNDRLATISRQITRGQPSAPSKVEEAPGFQAMEKAVRNIVEHLEVSDRRTRDNMKALQDRMSDMATRVTSSNSEQILRQAPAFNQLENRLSDLARRLEQMPPAAQSTQLTDNLRAELDHLAGRIDTVRESSEVLAARAQTAAVQAAQAELHTIEGRIVGLLNEAKQSISSQQVGPAEMQRFSQEIDRLNARIDAVSPTSSNDADVSALRVAVEQLSTRVAQGQDPRPIAELDRRVLEIAEKVELAEAARRDLPQMTDLERRFAELDQRLQQALQNPSPQGQEQLVQKIAEVDDRLARTEHQLGHLETIERAITQLYDAIEQNRKNTHDIAKDAASRMADQLAGQMAGQMAALGGAAPLALLSSAPEIMALESGLQAVREASETVDHRNQETLEAVHETLEQIVAKLAELETAAIGQRVAQAANPAHSPAFAAPPAATQSAPQVPFNTPFTAPYDPVAQAPLPTPEQMFQPAPQSGNFMDPVFAGTQSLFGAVDSMEATGNPFAAGSSDSMNATAPAADANINDWVTAARNLAQSGADTKNPISGYKPGTENKVKLVSKGISLPFLSRWNKGAKSAPMAVKAANGNAPASKLRLMALGLLLLGLATFATTNYLGRLHRAEAPVPLTTEPSAPGQSAPAANSAPTQVEPVPLAKPEGQSAASPQQQGDAGPIPGQDADPILTGALPAAKAPVVDVASAAAPAAQAVSVKIEPAVGPAKLRQSAENGDAGAQFIVATHYLNGDSVPTDYARAAYWYGKASAQGLAPAQYRLGTLYERGKGVDKNLSAALSWYERAGSLGNVKAMHNAAVIAAGTDAGQPDYAKAFKWFSLAASHGLKDSEYNLAVLIERGLGTKPDGGEALFWYLVAASQGDNDAQARVDALSTSLSASTVDAAKGRFKAWAPDKARDDANVVAVNDAQWNPVSAPPQSATSAMPANINDQAKLLLDKLGYRVGTQDGTLDAKTSNAIKLFQIQQGMKVTGQASPDLISVLQSKAG
jgi:localization factor PodJL